MRNGLYALCGVLLLATTMPALAQEMIAALKGPDDKPHGEVRVQSAPTGSQITVELTGIEEGWHGVHFHEKGVCDGSKAFADAGPHASVEGQTHGEHSDHAPHSGDLPNIYVGKDGIGKAQFFSKTTLDLLKDSDGSSFMVHAKADDYKTQPSGDSGDRIACGVLKPQ